MELFFKEKTADIYYAEEADPEELADHVARRKDIGILDWGDPENMIFVMVGDGRDPEVAKRMNQIKGRPENQVLAIAGFDGLLVQLGNLKRARTLTHTFELPVGLIVPAKEDLPDWVTFAKAGLRKVMIAGQSHNASMDYIDLFNPFVQKLAIKYRTFCAGTSANLRDRDVYGVYQQVKAYDEFKDGVDFFVMRRDLDPRYRTKHMTSCTAFDLEEERAIVKRWGSQDVGRFKKYLGNITIPHNVEILPGAEILLRSIFENELHPAARLRLLMASLNRLQLKRVS